MNTGSSAPAEPSDRRDRVLDCFQKALGHELASQLVAIQGLLQLLELEEGARLSPDGRDYLQRLAAAAQRAHRLVADVAEVGRLARQVHPAGTADPAEVAAEALAEVKQLFPGRAIAYHGSREALSLAVSRPALLQVLVRLLRGLATEGAESPLRVEVSAGADVAELRVVAAGLVLPPERLERIFEPFASGAGSGLEPFLARLLAEAWGGGVRAETAPSVGTAFVVTCPVSRVSAFAPNSPLQGQEPPDEGSRTRTRNAAP